MIGAHTIEPNHSKFPIKESYNITRASLDTFVDMKNDKKNRTWKNEYNGEVSSWNVSISSSDWVTIIWLTMSDSFFLHLILSILVWRKMFLIFKCNNIFNSKPERVTNQLLMVKIPAINNLSTIKKEGIIIVRSNMIMINFLCVVSTSTRLPNNSQI